MGRCVETCFLYAGTRVTTSYLPICTRRNRTQVLLRDGLRRFYCTAAGRRVTVTHEDKGLEQEGYYDKSLHVGLCTPAATKSPRQNGGLRMTSIHGIHKLTTSHSHHKTPNREQISPPIVLRKVAVTPPPRQHNIQHTPRQPRPRNNNPT